MLNWKVVITLLTARLIKKTYSINVQNFPRLKTLGWQVKLGLDLYRSVTKLDLKKQCMQQVC